MGDHQRTNAVTTVPHQGAVAVPNAERTGAVGTDEVQVAITIGVAAGGGGLQSPKGFVLEEVGFVGEDGVIKVQIVQADFFRVAVVVSCITFVGSHIVGLPTNCVAGDGVGHGHAEDVVVTLEVNTIVSVGEVIHAEAVILHSHGNNAGDGQRRQVNLRKGVVFLKHHHGMSSIRTHGDVFRFQVLTEVSIGTEDSNTALGQRRQLRFEGVEVDLGHICLGERSGISAGQVHVGQGTFWVDRVIVVGFSFVGNQNAIAIRREGQHVR